MIMGFAPRPDLELHRRDHRELLGLLHCTAALGFLFIIITVIVIVIVVVIRCIISIIIMILLLL